MLRNKEAERSVVKELVDNTLYMPAYKTWQMAMSSKVCEITWHKDSITCHEQCSGTDTTACLYMHLNTKLFIDTLYKEGVLKKSDVLKMELDKASNQGG